jgi:dipeptidyl aminopeptidase/acylaminoacyl peptidase
MSQPFQIDDLLLHRKILAIDIVPPAGAIAAAVREVDAPNDGYVSSLWLFPLDGGTPRRLTHAPGQDSSPRWSPDGGSLAFIRSADGATRVHLLSLGGGEARPCGDLPGAASSVRWSPDGRKLLVTASVPANAERRTAIEGAPPPSGASAPEVAWRLPYKTDGVGYLLARDIHLFEIDVESGEHRQLTHGSFDVYGFAPSPDGRRIAYVRSREGRFAHRTDLWVCEGDGSAPRRLTDDLATVLAPVWSPDGHRIAFAAARDDGDAQNGLHAVDVQGGDRRELGGNDLEIADGQSLHWTADGGQLLFTRAWRGCHDVCSVDAGSGELRVVLGGERQFGAFATDGRRLAYAVDDPERPSELWWCGVDGSGEQQVGEMNPWWHDRTPLKAERRRFEVPDGEGGRETIEGWLIRSADATGPLPLLDDAHGGPASYALLDFDTNVYWQVLCSQGWAVLALNAVGSASYGRDFCRRLQGRWGEVDLPQHLAAIEQLQAEGVCDERVAIAGKSYGGFLAAWAMGHTSVFRAGVVMAPVGNIETHYGTSDGGWYADPLYVASQPRFDRERARALSPLQSIERSTTPTLFLQGKDDERCPKCQSEELFVSLMRAGDTPTELVLYPNADHHFLAEGTPSCRRDAAARIIDWLRRWALRRDVAKPAGSHASV